MLTLPLAIHPSDLVVHLVGAGNSVQGYFMSAEAGNLTQKLWGFMCLNPAKTAPNIDLLLVRALLGGIKARNTF